MFAHNKKNVCVIEYLKNPTEHVSHKMYQMACRTQNTVNALINFLITSSRKYVK